MTDSKVEVVEQTAAEHPIAKSKPLPVTSPEVDILENEREVVVLADMPGVNESSVQIDLEGRELKVQGEIETPDLEGYSLAFKEYRPVNYRRVFSLGDDIDREGITAHMKDGILRLTLPKVQEAIPKRIEVISG